MSQPKDASRRLGGALVACLVLILTGVPGLAAPFDADPEAAAALLEELAGGYQVLALSDRYVLQPTDPEVDFRAVEVKAGAVAVDGESVTLDQLRESVGAAAETIFALAELGATESPPGDELRRRIERLAEEQRQKAEEMEELMRSRAEELEGLEQERLEALEEAEDEARREVRRERRRGRVRTDTRISFGSSLTIEPNETSREVVVLGGSLDVEGKVRGDAVVVGGSAEIRGEVEGTVTVIGGSVSLGPGARIEGDAISIGGAVHREPTAEIFGEITEVSLAPGFELDDVWNGVWLPHWHYPWFDFGVGELVARAGKTALLGVLLLVLLLLFPRLIAGVCDRALSEPWKAGIVGLGAQLLFLFALPLICIILLITIVGIPLALILAPMATLALVVLYLLGFAGVALAGGQLLEARFDWRGVSSYLLLLLGLALIQGWSILGEALGFVGGPVRVFAWIVLLLGFVIKYVAWTTGLGAILLHYLSPLPPSRSAALSAGGAPDLVPPPPVPSEPADWDATTVDVESAAESAEESGEDGPGEDDEYLRAGAGETETETSESDTSDASDTSDTSDAGDDSAR